MSATSIQKRVLAAIALFVACFIIGMAMVVSLALLAGATIADKSMEPWALYGGIAVVFCSALVVSMVFDAN